MERINQKLGRHVKKIREKLGLSQEELAERADVHPSYIGIIERGEKTPSIHTIEKLAAALNVSMQFLFSFQGGGAKPAGDVSDYMSRETLGLLRDIDTKNKRIILNVVKTMCRDLKKTRA
ncbi:MAG: helix-turn-helix transcriptional regulator [Proteobacteria bacterium]|nr:helix-turn-helix transcriptional regulator [Pseudomonadota bacterium]MBU2567974.1 helix-turn-helix transcriptional regulator [Elusimicrobiota bacterium]